MRLALFLLFTSCGTLTTNGAAELTGRVVDREGHPVFGAKVMLIRSRRPVATTKTTADGRFSLTSSAEPASLLALAGEADEGAWRSEFRLRAAGQTDLGDLELEKVWAHDEVLWLRDTGYDEQLSRPEDELQYLWGGKPGEPLLATKLLRTHQQVVRVLDDGTTQLLADEPWVDPFSVTVEPGTPPPPVLSVSAARSAGGTPYVLLVEGGFSWVSAAGVTSSPVRRLRWLEVERGTPVFEVGVPEGASCSWSASRGALVASTTETSWFDLASRRRVPLSPTGGVTLVPIERGIALLDVSFDAATAQSRVTMTRIVDGSVSRSEPVQVNGRFRESLGSAAGSASAVFVADREVVVVRFDPITLAAAVTRVDTTSSSFSLLPSCIDRSRAPMTLFGLVDGTLELVRIGDTLERATTPFDRLNVVSGCTDDRGLWFVTANPQRLLRVVDGNASVTALDPETSVWSFGEWQRVDLVENGVRRARVTKEVDLSRLRPLGRSPFLATAWRNEDDPSSLVAVGLVGNGRSALFRVRP